MKRRLIIRLVPRKILIVPEHPRASREIQMLARERQIILAIQPVQNLLPQLMAQKLHHRYCTLDPERRLPCDNDFVSLTCVFTV